MRINNIKKQQQQLNDQFNNQLSGSGINAGWVTGKITKKGFWLESSFHCMNEHGYYDGWQPFAVFIPADDYSSFRLVFRGDQYKARKYQLREYLENTVYCQLTMEG